MSKALRVALAKRSRAEQAVQDVMHRDYPPGRQIFWMMRNIMHSGTVVMNCYGDRIKVRSTRTAKEYVIHAWRVADAFKDA